MTDLLEQYSELSKILHKLNQARSARYQALKSAFKPAEASDKPAPFAARWAPELSGLASGKRGGRVMRANGRVSRDAVWARCASTVGMTLPNQR